MLPVSRPPIDNGAVLVAGHRIVQVGRWPEMSTPRRAAVVDLGDTLLLPGLVNAHCHLDYTDLAGRVPPQKSFTNWIKLMTATKAERSDAEFAESWLHGADMLLRSGTTTVGDFEVLPHLLPSLWAGTPLRVISFLELTGVKSRRDPRSILAEAERRIRSLPRHPRCRAAIAPHAPYSTLPELVRRAARLSSRRRWPLSIHVAESTEEFEMFTRAGGPMFDWLKLNQRDASDCGLGSPVQHLERCGALAPNLLAVHVNYLAPGDAARLGHHHVSVVHCPRSHVYFGHRKFPFRELSRARVNICLGTDSLATVYKRRKDTVELNLFEELRAFAKAHPRVAREKLLNLVTVNAARALGLAGKIGELTPGTLADLVALPFSGPLNAAHEAALEHRGDVSANLIHGQWAVPPAA